MLVRRRVVGTSHALSGTALPNSNAKIQLLSTCFVLVETKDGDNLVVEVPGAE